VLSIVQRVNALRPDSEKKSADDADGPQNETELPALREVRVLIPGRTARRSAHRRPRSAAPGRARADRSPAPGAATCRAAVRLPRAYPSVAARAPTAPALRWFSLPAQASNFLRGRLAPRPLPSLQSPGVRAGRRASRVAGDWFRSRMRRRGTRS